MRGPEGFGIRRVSDVLESDFFEGDSALGAFTDERQCRRDLQRAGGPTGPMGKQSDDAQRRPSIIISSPSSSGRIDGTPSLIDEVTEIRAELGARRHDIDKLLRELVSDGCAFALVNASNMYAFVPPRAPQLAA